MSSRGRSLIIHFQGQVGKRDSGKAYVFFVVEDIAALERV